MTDDWDNWADREMGRLSSMYNHPAFQIREPEIMCDLCGDGITEDDESAEMYDTTNPDGPSVICHAQCGLNQGMEIA